MLIETKQMSPQEAREHIERLRISQQAFARLIHVNPSTVRRWLTLSGDALDIPRAVQITLRLLTPAHVRRLIEADDETRT